MKTQPYQPKTGQKCHCKPGIHRDNCPDCEGTGWRIDFAAIRARNSPKLAPPITQIEMTETDIELAERAAKCIGFTQTAYTSTSGLWGLFCLPDHARMKEGCFIKTKEFGLLFVSDLEDLQLHDLAKEEKGR